MKRYMVLLLVLSGCTPIFFNEPHLASIPSDSAKYKSDLTTCEEEQRPTKMEVFTSFATGGLGALPAGAAMAGTEAGEGKDMLSFKSGYTIRDECMERKGYVLAK